MAAKSVRPLRFEGDVAYVPLTMGYEAVIDAADSHLVAGRNWCATLKHRPDGSIRGVYARSNRGRRESQSAGGSGGWVWMHKILLQVPEGCFVDHADGNGLNNLRSNLRAATHSQNQRNKSVRSDNQSGLKGVCILPGQRFRAVIHADGQRKHLGCFDSAELAQRAYVVAAERHFGDFARAP